MAQIILLLEALVEEVNVDREVQGQSRELGRGGAASRAREGMAAGRGENDDRCSLCLSELH